VESFKDTNGNVYGFVDLEDIVDIDGIETANIASNAADVPDRGEYKKIKNMITFDDGASSRILCDPFF